MSDNTQATDPFNGRLERAVLESSTPAISTELSMYFVETIRAMAQDRLIRVSHPTALDEPVYILVTAEVVSKVTAHALMRNDPAKVQAVVTETEPAEDGADREILCSGGRPLRFGSGKRYRVQYRAPGGSLREAVVNYLGIGFSGLDFDGRPDHGTVTILPVRIRSAEEVPPNTAGYVDRKVS